MGDELVLFVLWLTKWSQLLIVDELGVDELVRRRVGKLMKYPSTVNCAKFLPFHFVKLRSLHFVNDKKPNN